MDKKPSITGCEIGKKVTEAFRKGLEAENFESNIATDYTGVATGVKRHASFNYTSVAGYALA